MRSTREKERNKMAQDKLRGEIWPTVLAEGYRLYAMVNEDENIEYLIFSSVEKKKTYVRDNSAWAPLHDLFFRDVEDLGLFDYEVDTQFIRYYDAVSSAGEVVPYEFDESTVTAAAQTAELSSCPPATLDIVLNLKNRQKAIDSVGYGPLNPNLLNQDFWKTKAEMWSVSIDEAKKSRCANCAMFVVNSKMLSCIAAGIEQGGSAAVDAQDSIVAAELGYCEAFDFKCAASRTCDAWVVGGTITDSNKQNKGV